MSHPNRVTGGYAGAHQSWANTDDRTARTAPGRDAAFARFEREVDPDGNLDPAERHRRALHAQRAHMARLSLKAAQARGRKARKRNAAAKGATP